MTRRRLAPLLVALALAAAPAATAAPEAQVVRQVQERLDALGFGAVDASTLTTRQIAALYLELDGRNLAPGDLHSIEARQKIRVILGWD